MNKYISFGLLTIFACCLSSCSVAMAASKNGTNISQVQQCKTRNQFIAKGGVVISSERLSNGDLEEHYQFQKERGSTARAFMHGILDVSTLGIWEVIGTPIEGCDSKEYFCIKATYDKNNNLKNVSLN